MRRPRKHHVQLSLDSARRPTGRGGWRPGAGRKRKPGTVAHTRRPPLASRFPQHVTLRVANGAPSLARRWLMTIIRKAVGDSHKDDFRIAEFNVLGNHLHLISEATDERRLARGIQGFEVRVARRLNRALARRGKLFAHRYHARYLTSPREVRNALRYVLLNRKHHAAEQRFSKTWFDPFSSAAWFTGWATPLRATLDCQQELLEMERPTAVARTWLLSTGWMRHGPLRVDERPA